MERHRPYCSDGSMDEPMPNPAIEVPPSSHSIQLPVKRPRPFGEDDSTHRYMERAAPSGGLLGDLSASEIMQGDRSAPPARMNQVLQMSDGNQYRKGVLPMSSLGGGAVAASHPLPSYVAQNMPPFGMKEHQWMVENECAMELAEKAYTTLSTLCEFMQATSTHRVSMTYAHQAHFWLQQCMRELQQDATSKMPLVDMASAAYRNYRLNDFKFMETIGTGTFGSVKLCQCIPTKEFMCVKVLSKAKVCRMKQQEHVRNEKAILSQAQHPFIVNLYTTLQDCNSLYFFMEYVPGGELFTAIKRAGRLSLPVARFYAAEIVLVVEFLHSYDCGVLRYMTLIICRQNVVHRDLKPENLLVDAEGHMKLTDFGFAKQVVDKTWTMCGTPEYIAPEIILSKGHGKGVDWWSLGILIYEMLVGHPPFQGESNFEVFENVLRGKTGPRPPDIDGDAWDLILGLLSIDLTQRLGCMRNGANDIKQHPFFKSINFTSILERRTFGPVIPVISRANDTRNYAFYPPDAQSVEEFSYDGNDDFADF